VDCINKVINLVDPKKQTFNEDNLLKIQHDISRFMVKVFPNDVDLQTAWSCKISVINHFKELENDFDGGIYLILIIYCLVQDIPMYSSEQHCIPFRINLRSWIKNGEIPLHSFV